VPQPTLKRRYTYDDLALFPDDHLRRELIDGELIVTPSPRLRHQAVAGEIFYALSTWVREHGGKVYTAPVDVKFSDHTVLIPDLLFVREEHRDRLQERFFAGAPDVAVEVSSPSDRHLELMRKRSVYERFGVTEYWYVDLEVDRVEVHRLTNGVYRAPTVLQRGDVLTSPEVPGFALAVSGLLDAS
jgi:Uma2 family endonuclease